MLPVTYEDRVAKEALQVDAKRCGICRILEPEPIENRRPIHVRFLRNLSYQWPALESLINSYFRPWVFGTGTPY